MAKTEKKEKTEPTPKTKGKYQKTWESEYLVVENGEVFMWYLEKVSWDKKKHKCTEFWAWKRVPTQ